MKNTPTKIHAFFKSGILRWILLYSIYFLALGLLITSKSNSAVILYIFLFLFSLSSVPRLFLSSNHKKSLLLSFFLSTFFYMFLFNFINNIEFWGDEIEEIRMANFPFGDVLTHVRFTYYAAPPFGFWGLWVWNHFSNHVLVEFYEFFYRIPYMFIHSLSAGIFGILVLKISKFPEKDKHWTKKLIVFIPAFLTFIVNPTLFFYSIEVRSYAIATLGSLTVLYFFIFIQNFRRKHIFLLFFFCLHTVTQFLLLVPFWFKLFLHKKDRLFTIIGVSMTGVLAVIIRGSLTSPKTTTPQESYKLIIEAVLLFFSVNFSTITQLLFLLLALLFAIKAKNKIIFSIAFCILFFVFVVILSAFNQKYFDFHVRHLSFIIPWILLFIFSPLMYVNTTKKKLFLIGILVVFTFPWAQQTHIRLTEQNLFSKSLIGAKIIALEASTINGSIILLPDEERRLSIEVYEFFERSFRWYADQHKVPLVAPDTTETACTLFHNQKNSIIVNSAFGSIPCKDFYPEKRFFGTTVKSNFIEPVPL